ncbi:hypothetical protein H0H92_001928 [Tricholoma furcatifolium]|nr:hypothetical protein H0H92_001928 [Tricholoma furcatifolium]
MANLVVILGGEKAGITQKVPLIVRGQDHPPFPMPIKCKTEEDALRINRLQSMIQRMMQEGASSERMHDVFFHSQYISQFRGEYHAFFLGKKLGIYSDWEGPDNGKAQLNSVARYTKWHTFTTLRGALLYMVSKGSHFLGDEEPGAYGTEYDPSLVTSPISSPMKNSQRTRPTKKPHRELPSPRTPSPSKISRCELPHSPPPPATIIRGPQRISMKDLAEDLQSISFDAPSTQRPSAFVYQWSRSLDGTLRPLYTPPIRPIHRNVDFGPIINSYLDFHGYDQASVVTIENSVLTTDCRKPTVVEYLANYGMARRDAEWIWDHIAWGNVI